MVMGGVRETPWNRKGVEAAPGTDAQNTLVLDTSKGQVVIRLRSDLAPKHAERMKTLARDKFYDNAPFHRVITGFMAQTGDGEKGNGTGKSKYPDLPQEFSNIPFKRGTVGMARSSSPNSANAQFFIMFAPANYRLTHRLKLLSMVRTRTASKPARGSAAVATPAVMRRKSRATASWPRRAAARCRSRTCQPSPPARIATRMRLPEQKAEGRRQKAEGRRQ